MAKVDFYILNAPGEAARQQFACRLAEKAYRLQNSVHILTGSQGSAAQIDELLWTFRDGSFVPHEVVSRNDTVDSPVTIGFDLQTARKHDLLINLSDGVPDVAEAFPRVAEIVTSDEESRRNSRERYAAYRDGGHSLATHKL
jgi:DNA polymerase-3 subunit chi